MTISAPNTQIHSSAQVYLLFHTAIHPHPNRAHPGNVNLTVLHSQATDTSPRCIWQLHKTQQCRILFARPVKSCSSCAGLPGAAMNNTPPRLCTTALSTARTSTHLRLTQVNNPSRLWSPPPYRTKARRYRTVRPHSTTGKALPF